MRVTLWLLQLPDCDGDLVDEAGEKVRVVRFSAEGEVHGVGDTSYYAPGGGPDTPSVVT